MWAQPPLAILHSFTKHLPFGSSWPPGQSTLPSHTLLFGMHIPPPQSNSVFRSHRFIGAAKGFFRKKKKNEIYSYRRFLFYLEIYREREKKFDCEMGDYSGLKLTAIDLVTAIGTFSSTWAHQMAWNTSVVIALELIITARFILAIDQTLVVTVRTIAATITKPLTIDASNFIVTQVISWRANWQRNLFRVIAILFNVTKC